MATKEEIKEVFEETLEAHGIGRKTEEEIPTKKRKSKATTLSADLKEMKVCALFLVCLTVCSPFQG